MRLAAIYIENHEYLFDKPQTINFGGYYNYEFNSENNLTTIKATVNDQFIENLFDLTKIDIKITNLNSIVGQNGSGKSSILDIIRGIFSININAFPWCNIVAIGETDDNEIFSITNGYKNITVYNENGELIDIEKLSKDFNRKDIQTIFYSPHFDYKYNLNFDNIDNYDISFDKILEQDLSNINNNESNSNGIRHSPSIELIYKNSLRQIEFLNSDLVSKKQIFKDIFHLPNHNDPILEIRIRKREREWNTPNAFTSAIKDIFDKIEVELNQWAKIKNPIDVDKYILKRKMLEAMLSTIYSTMEKKNYYLNEGVFSYVDFKKILDSSDAYTLLVFLINNVKLSYKSGELLIFDDTKFESLLIQTYETIDEINEKELISQDTFQTTPEKAKTILELQRNVINTLNRYYPIEPSDSGRSDRDKVEPFINYMPFTKRLSSGENALLNLFSRLFAFINENYGVNKYRPPKEHFILLFDEADLSFHPSWKKNYIKSLLKTIPYFFEELENKPSIQIIFTTHDPLTLSDLPNRNVTYIARKDYDSKSNILEYGSQNRPKKTFGANISELLADSFFIDDALIGNFASDKIQETIEWLNKKDDRSNPDYHKKIISLIDEPIVSLKLSEMYDEKMETNIQLLIIDKQIQILNNLKSKLSI